MKNNLYVISNFGEYAQSIYNENCSWAFAVDSAMIFKSYKKAYYYMNKINKLYGFNRCKVERLKSKQYYDWAWNKLTHYAV